MKKTSSPTIKNISGVKLYRDDLKEIVALFREDNVFQGEIETKNNIYSFDEIERIDDFNFIKSISVSNPILLQIRFINYLIGGVELKAYDSTALAVGIIEKLYNFLLTKRRRFFYFITSVLPQILNSILIVLGVTYIFADHYIVKKLLAITVLTVLCLICLGFFINEKISCNIFKVSKPKSFIDELKEQKVTIIVTIACTFLTTPFWPQIISMLRGVFNYII